MRNMNCEYVREYYNVPAEIGRIIIFKERRGIIVEDRGNYIGVNFDDSKPGVIFNLHPTWNVEYLGIGKIRKMTQSQKRYRKYISSEYPGSFAEFLGLKKAERQILE